MQNGKIQMIRSIEHITEKELYTWLDDVKDPEIPVLSITDMGVVRKVENIDGKIIITITPTYSGCPAMKVIEEDITACLHQHGLQNIEVITTLSPAWTTDWLTEEGKRKLEEYGIAPPVNESVDKNLLFQSPKEIRCPQCKSTNTEMVSQFGSTACKAMYKCNDCLEPFDYFKCI